MLIHNHVHDCTCTCTYTVTQSVNLSSHLLHRVCFYMAKGTEHTHDHTHTPSVAIMYHAQYKRVYTAISDLLSIHIATLWIVSVPPVLWSSRSPAAPSVASSHPPPHHHHQMDLVYARACSVSHVI